MKENNMTEKAKSVWDDIKALPVNYFGVRKTITDIVECSTPNDTEQAILKGKFPAAISALEEGLGLGMVVLPSPTVVIGERQEHKFVIEQTEKFIIVKRKQ